MERTEELNQIIKLHLQAISLYDDFHKENAGRSRSVIEACKKEIVEIESGRQNTPV